MNAVFGQEEKEAVQEFKYKNAAQVELFGHGIIYSLNYERIIFNAEKYKTTAQVGGSYYPKVIGFSALWLPIMLNQLFSFHKHHVEMGVGHIFTKDNIKREEPPVSASYLYGNSDWAHLARVRIGFRFQKPSSRFCLK
jgi:hypothetical protein